MQDLQWKIYEAKKIIMSIRTCIDTFNWFVYRWHIFKYIWIFKLFWFEYIHSLKNMYDLRAMFVFRNLFSRSKYFFYICEYRNILRRIYLFKLIFLRCWGNKYICILICSGKIYICHTLGWTCTVFFSLACRFLMNIL